MSVDEKSKEASKSSTENVSTTERLAYFIKQGLNVRSFATDE
jgi:hypothetical protein